MAKKGKKQKLATGGTVEGFIEIGSGIMNRFPNGSQKVFLERWTSFFNAEPEVVAHAWSLLIEDEGFAEELFIDPAYLLWALMLLKMYSTEPVLAGMLGVDEDTFRKWAWYFIEEVSYLEPEVVSFFYHLFYFPHCFIPPSHFVSSVPARMCKILFANRKKGDVGNDCMLQVDGTDCKATNQGVCPKAFYSFKFKSSGLRYEVANNIITDDICSITGPMPPGDWPDVEVFRFALKGDLDENERVETDDGYIGEDPCFTKCPGGIRSMEDERWHAKRSKARNRGETVNHRLKTFGVLGGTFRHDIEKHSMCFRACAVFVQLSFQIGSKKLLSVNNYNQEWMDPSRAPMPEGPEPDSDDVSL